MSERPVQCKFCGTGCNAELQGILTFRCGSVWFHESKKWMQFSGCERSILRARIGRAVELLQKAQRYDYGSTAYMEAPLQPSEAGDWVSVDDVVKAIQILQEGQQ